MVEEKRIVYVIRSDSQADRHYTGLTSDLEDRLRWHKESRWGYGIRYRPWSILVALHFGDERTTRRFEQYLKSGSGRAFARRHFAPAEPDAQDDASDD